MEESIVDKLKQVRQRIEAIEDEKYRVAFMYQFLIGGDAGEVSGDNAPQCNDMIIADLDVQGRKTSVVFFIVKTVRKEEHYRVCAIPLNAEYEPWVSIVCNWFQKNKKEYPFRFSKGAKLESNKKYLMDKAKVIFFGLKWFKESYTFHGKQQERRWVDFTSSQLRDLRHHVLKELYGFNEIDLAYFGAWNDSTINMQITLEVERILETKIDKNDIQNIKKIGQSYIEKLLKKYETLGNIETMRMFDPLNTGYRFKRASRITKLIQDINLISNIKLKTLLFNEDMGFVLNLFTECNKDIELKSNITNMMNLFEINLERLREIVNDSKNRKLISMYKKGSVKSVGPRQRC